LFWGYVFGDMFLGDLRLGDYFVWDKLRLKGLGQNQIIGRLFSKFNTCAQNVYIWGKYNQV
jgi:hypothetical protein